MRRREFMFRSAQAAALLCPILSIRRAEAQEPPKRALVWVNSSGYPFPEDFFPSGTENDWQLSPILADFEGLKDEMVVVDGIDIRNSGLNPKGNNHIRSMGKVLTAKDVLAADDPQDGNAGGISVDQLVAQELGLSTLELQINNNSNDHMRHRPFALGPNAFKPPEANPLAAFNQIFEDFSGGDDPAAIAEMTRKLTLKQSLLDGVSDDLARFRSELTGVEKLKLDIHEDAIRRAEENIAKDLQALAEGGLTCEAPNAPDVGNAIADRAQAMTDLAFAALVCDRVQMLGMLWGFSGQHWKYEWAGVTGIAESGHDEVHHRAGERRDEYIAMVRWDWNQLRLLIERLRDTPEGDGNMLDNTVVYATSNFGRHHQLDRIPVAFFGNAQGALQTGRLVKLNSTQNNDKVLTSFAHLMGANITGIGDEPDCGPLPEL